MDTAKEVVIVIGSLGLLFGLLLGIDVVSGYVTSEQTIHCYEILKDKSAAELRITCGAIR